LIERSPLQIQRDVLLAMLIRELKTRFGALKFGYAWMLLEPILHVALFSALFYFKGSDMYPGIPTPLFILAGIVPWLCFSKCVSLGLAAVSANRGLFNYRQVRPFDAVLARVVLEFAVLAVSLVALFAIFWWLGISSPFNDILVLLTVSALFFMLCMGISLILCVLGERYPEATKLVPALLRPMYFMSGIFFSLEHVPPQYHVYLSWNPMLHIIEQFRIACFSKFNGFYADLSFLVIFSVSVLFLGLLVYRVNWVELVRSK
jgi:capsular polysaccharide transport system permease protein